MRVFCDRKQNRQYYARNHTGHGHDAQQGEVEHREEPLERREAETVIS